MPAGFRERSLPKSLRDSEVARHALRNFPQPKHSCLIVRFESGRPGGQSCAFRETLEPFGRELKISDITAMRPRLPPFRMQRFYDLFPGQVIFSLNMLHHP